MLKTKIRFILALWTPILAIILTFQVAAAFLRPGQADSLNAQPAKPQVLGANTITRGPGVKNTLSLSQAKPFDEKQINAQSYLVFDLDSGNRILAKDIHKRLSIASLTKLLTGLTAYNLGILGQKFVLKSQPLSAVRPSLGLKLNDTVEALDLFNAMIVGSCNDAAEALAKLAQEKTSSDFVSLMNIQAKALNMFESKFSNPKGFDNEENYSTSADLQLLITATQKLSIFNDLGRRTDYAFTSELGNNYFTLASNLLIKDHPDIYAIKTGYSEHAKETMATKIQIFGHKLVILVLNSEDRDGDTLKLKNYLESTLTLSQ